MSNEPQKTTEYTWKGRTGPFNVSLTPGVFKPTSTSVTLAEAMEIHDGDVVVDVGCGSGVLTFVAARLKAAMAYGCDLSSEAVKTAGENARRLGISAVTEFRAGNLLEPVKDIRADVIIGDVSGIPDPIALATGWFPDGMGGGPTGAGLPVASAMGSGMPETSPMMTSARMSLTGSSRFPALNSVTADIPRRRAFSPAVFTASEERSQP